MLFLRLIEYLVAAIVGLFALAIGALVLIVQLVVEGVRWLVDRR